MIALDFDPTAEKVAETGYQLAKTMQASVILVHGMADAAYYMPVDYSPVMGFTGFSSADMLQPVEYEALKQSAKEYLESSKKHLGDDSIETLVLEGDLVSSLLETAREKEVKVLVVGTHSRSGFEEMLTGSTTRKLLHETTIPIFVVPTKR